MISFSYQKLSGAGNTFIVVDGRNNQALQEVDGSRLARAACSTEHEHGGADGLILLESSDVHDFTMHYYNRDGSTGMMCGNGGRCAVQFAVGHGYVSAEELISFTNAGVLYRAEVNDKRVRVSFPDPIEIQLNLSLEVLGQRRLCHYVDVGTPHLIFFTSDLDVDKLADLNIERWGSAARNHSSVEPGGANANFVEIVSGQKGILLRTFERGVEGETGACGTGAIASGIVSGLLYGLLSPVSVLPTSGSPLSIHFYCDEDQKIHNVGLEGEAEVLMEGTLSLANLPLLHP